jgi:hypothetical protein
LLKILPSEYQAPAFGKIFRMIRFRPIQSIPDMRQYRPVAFRPCFAASLAFSYFAGHFSLFQMILPCKVFSKKFDIYFTDLVVTIQICFSVQASIVLNETGQVMPIHIRI